LLIAIWLLWRYAGAASEQTAQPAAHRVASTENEPGVLRFPADAPQLTALRIATAEAQLLPAYAPMNGRVAYDENRTARVSSPVLGRVTALHADAGDTVRSGQPLLDIDSPDVATSDADLSKALADAEVKQLAVERARKLFDGQVIAKKDLEAAEADFRQASAEAQRARLKLRNLHATGNEDGRFQLRAPISGVIADQQVNPGLEVRPDLPSPLFTITDISHLWVIVDVAEGSISGIHPGQTVTIEADAWPGQTFSGMVERVGLALDPGTRRIQVRCASTRPPSGFPTAAWF
jgi:cobalt-zinc-cadmium efflux system membrane fusion protein